MAEKKIPKVLLVFCPLAYISKTGSARGLKFVSTEAPYRL